MKAVRRENTIRGMFSFFAASTLLYMAAENADYMMRTRDYRAALIVVFLSACAVFEAYKVGNRVEYVLGLRDATMGN